MKTHSKYIASPSMNMVKNIKPFLLIDASENTLLFIAHCTFDTWKLGALHGRQGDVDKHLTTCLKRLNYYLFLIVKVDDCVKHSSKGWLLFTSL